MITCVRMGERVSFDLGDVVRLKGTAPGPAMTITGFTEGGRFGDRFPLAICQWVVARVHPISNLPEHTIACRAFDCMQLTKEPRDQVL